MLEGGKVKAIFALQEKMSIRQIAQTLGERSENRQTAI